MMQMKRSTVSCKVCYVCGRGLAVELWGRQRLKPISYIITHFLRLYLLKDCENRYFNSASSFIDLTCVLAMGQPVSYEENFMN